MVIAFLYNAAMAIEATNGVLIRSGKDAQRIGKHAELRFARQIERVLTQAGIMFELEMSPELDGKEKTDVRVTWECTTGDQQTINFQVSISAKSRQEQVRLERRKVRPVVVSPTMEEHDIEVLVCSHLFPNELPERYKRYRSNAYS